MGLVLPKERGRLYITRPPCALCIIRSSAAFFRYTVNALCTDGGYPMIIWRGNRRPIDKYGTNKVFVYKYTSNRKFDENNRDACLQHA